MALKPGATTRSPSVGVGHTAGSPSTSLAAKSTANPYAKSMPITTNQAAAALKRAGMPVNKIGLGVAIGMAECGGHLDAHATSPPNQDGSIDRGWAQINNKAHPNVTDAQAYAVYGCAMAMTTISTEGQNFRPWTTFQHNLHLPYLKAGNAAADYIKNLPASGIDKILGEVGGAIGGAAGDIAGAAVGIFDAAKAMPTAVVKLVQTLVNPSILGKLVAEASVWMLKTFGKAFYQYIVLPPWHWSERASQYYWNNTVLDSDNSGQGIDQYGLVITAFAWTAGYSILFGKAEQPRSLSAPSRETPLARTIQSGTNLVARRALTPAKEVEKKTPSKPKQAWSSAELDTLRTLSVERRRPVTVASTPTEGDVDSRIERETIREVTKQREREATRLARSEAQERVQAAKVAEAAGLTPAEYSPARVGPRTRRRTSPQGS